MRLQSDEAWVRAHPPLLGQLLDNLLDNALEHGRPGTPIFVETIREGGVVVLAVEDAGPGILPEDLPHVFEPFYRSAQTAPTGYIRRRTGPGRGPAHRGRLRRVCQRAERTG